MSTTDLLSMKQPGEELQETLTELDDRGLSII